MSMNSFVQTQCQYKQWHLNGSYIWNQEYMIEPMTCVQLTLVWLYIYR